MSLTKVANEMNKFLGAVQRGQRFIQQEITRAEDALALSHITDGGLVNGISAVMDSIDWKTKLVLGTLTSGGVGLAAWGTYHLQDDEEQENIRHINSHFSENHRLKLNKES